MSLYSPPQPLFPTSRRPGGVQLRASGSLLSKSHPFAPGVDNISLLQSSLFWETAGNLEKPFGGRNIRAENLPRRGSGETLPPWRRKKTRGYRARGVRLAESFPRWPGRKPIPPRGREASPGRIVSTSDGSSRVGTGVDFCFRRDSRRGGNARLATWSNFP